MTVQEQLGELQLDSVTGLPGRALFADRLMVALEQMRRYGGGVAVVVIDFAGAAGMRAALGLEAGDELRRLATEHLQFFLRRSDTLAYLGGDLFAILMPRTGELAAVVAFSQRLMKIFDGHWEVTGHELHLSPGVGVACCLRSDEDAGQLLADAVAAAAEAARSGGRLPRIADPEQRLRTQGHMALEADLRRAQRRGEFELYYQPQVSAATGVTSGLEALLRWRHPNRGLISPAEFIPLAEETRLIVPIGEWVIAEACRQIAEWRKAGLPARRVAVNLSALQLDQDDLLSVVGSALRSHEVPRGQLELEITETAALSDEQRTWQVLEGLRQLGVRLTLDDFGTGYASAFVLAEYPFDTLKIDRSFVIRLAGGGKPRLLTRAVIAFAHAAGMTVVAEGVETIEQLRLLREMGADEIQGFLFARPLPPDDCVPYLMGECAVSVAAADAAVE